MEVIRQIMHTLHLLLSVHLQPFFHIDSQMLELFFKTHLGPSVRVEAIRAGRVNTFPIRRHTDFISALPSSSTHLGSRHPMFNRVITLTNGSNLVIIQIVVVNAATHDLTTVLSLSPDLFLRQLVESFEVLGWRLNDTREKSLRDLIHLTIFLEVFV